MLRLLRQKVGMPCLLLSLGAAGLCLSVLLSPPEEAQTITSPLPEIRLKPPAAILAPDVEAAHDPHPDLLEPQVLLRESDCPFGSMILEASTHYDVEPELVRAIIMTESRFDPKAVSKKGARGLMQLMPLTAKAMGVKDVFDPHTNIRAGVRYFKSLLDRFEGDVTLALAAYHAGGRRVKRHRGVPPIRATRHYVGKVLRYYDTYKKEAEG